MNEHTFVRSIHNRLKGKLHIWKVAAGFANGVPDAWYSGNKGDLWVEYKWGKYPLSTLQRLWLTARHAEGRRCWVVTGTDKGVVVYTQPPYPEKIPIEQTLYTVAEYCALLLNVCVEQTEENIHDNPKREHA